MSPTDGLIERGYEPLGEIIDTPGWLPRLYKDVVIRDGKYWVRLMAVEDHTEAYNVIRDREHAAMFEPCPMTGDVHNLRGDMVDLAGYSCNKCHKTWDLRWRPTYG